MPSAISLLSASAALSILLLLYAPTQAASFTTLNLIANGSFEGYSKQDTYVPQGWCSTYLSGVQITCTDSVSVDNTPWHIYNTVDLLFQESTIACPDGLSCVDLNSDLPGGVSTAISVTPGEAYTLRFQLGGQTTACDSSCAAGFSVLRNVTVSVWDLAIDAPVFTSAATVDLTQGCQFVEQTFNISVPATLSGAAELRIYSADVANNCGPLLDDVRLTWLLWGLTTRCTCPPPAIAIVRSPPGNPGQPRASATPQRPHGRRAAPTASRDSLVPL